MRCLGLVFLVGCGFSGYQGGNAGDGDASPGGPDGTNVIPSQARRLTFTIAAGKVNERLTNFPVYVDVTQADLKARLDAAGTTLSFKRRVGSTVESLAYELQSFDATTGQLRAWVRLPEVSNTADTGFELWYGAAEVKEPQTPAVVWSQAYKTVFHLEGATAPIVDSVGVTSGTPMMLSANPSVAGKLGKGIDFNGDNQAGIKFRNPLVGSAPSTISVWVSQRSATDKDALVALGSGTAAAAARILLSQFNINEIAAGLYATNDWSSTGVNIQNASWTLLHWTYKNGVSSLYRNGVAIAGSPHDHGVVAATQGTEGWLGASHANSLYQNDSGLNGILDEVRISDVDRSAGWIKAEFDNQSAPTSFLATSSPSAIP
jgi:Concanavalin A-like lectin/glucanases superfamily